jgi:GTP-binding protein
VSTVQYRNIAIIAHVDHGKTTLVDKLLREGGAFTAREEVEERAMDSMDLEREKGITIKAKNASLHWGGVTINIVDTPGHADFGGEVERIMKMVDGVLLLVDAVDGPQAQTRFVLQKALHHGLKPIVVINKIDREHANPHRVHDQVLELLLDLHANEEQFNCPFIYASARDGFAVLDLDEPRNGMVPLFETIVKHIPPPKADATAPFQMLVSNLDWSDYVGRIAIGRIIAGQVKAGDSIVCIHKDGKRDRAKVSKVFEFSGMRTSEMPTGEAGNIIGLAGFEELDIGETLCDSEDREPIPFIDIDPPTIQMQFCVNDGPLAGREGKFLTSRQLRERLYKETRTNISLAVTGHRRAQHLPGQRARRTADRHPGRADAARGLRDAGVAARSDHEATTAARSWSRSRPCGWTRRRTAWATSCRTWPAARPRSPTCTTTATA